MDKENGRWSNSRRTGIFRSGLPVKAGLLKGAKNPRQIAYRGLQFLLIQKIMHAYTLQK